MLFRGSREWPSRGGSNEISSRKHPPKRRRERIHARSGRWSFVDRRRTRGRARRGVRVDGDGERRASHGAQKVELAPRRQSAPPLISEAESRLRTTTRRGVALALRDSGGARQKHCASRGRRPSPHKARIVIEHVSCRSAPRRADPNDIACRQRSDDPALHVDTYAHGCDASTRCDRSEQARG